MQYLKIGIKMKHNNWYETHLNKTLSLVKDLKDAL